MPYQTHIYSFDWGSGECWCLWHWSPPAEWIHLAMEVERAATNDELSLTERCCSFRETGTKKWEILILSCHSFHSEVGEMSNRNVSVLLWLQEWLEIPRSIKTLCSTTTMPSQRNETGKCLHSSLHLSAHSSICSSVCSFIQPFCQVCASIL